MKWVKYLWFIFLILGCNNHRKQAAKKNPSQISSRNKMAIRSFSIIYDSTLNSNKLLDSIQVSFQASFINDSVKVIMGNEVVYKKIITTDDRIGLADSFKINRYENNLNGKKPIEIVINQNTPIKIDNYLKYNFVDVTLKNDKINIKLTNKISYYK
jgi:hypothetical protein